MKDGMIKLISSASFNDTVDVGMRIVEDPAGKLVKSAATVFNCDYKDIAPDKDHVGIHLVALGDFEHYGNNRNGDSFNKQACIKYHDTFVKYAKVFRHHCFVAGTKILMSNFNWKNIETITNSDSVFTHTGHVGGVVTLMQDRYNGPLYRFSIRGLLNKTFTCTEDHLLFVLRGDAVVCKRTGANACNKCYPHTVGSHKLCSTCSVAAGRNWQPEWMPAKYVRYNDYVLVPRHYAVNSTTDILTCDDAYFLGLAFSEECFHKPIKHQHVFSLTFNVKETELVNLCLQYCSTKGWHVRGPYRHKDNNTSTIQICDKIAYAYLTKMLGGITYSDGRRVPSVLFSCSRDVILAFLSGFMDGDGSYSINMGLRGRTTSFEGLYDLHRLACVAGVYANINSDGQAHTQHDAVHNVDYACRPSGVITIPNGACAMLIPWCKKLQQHSGKIPDRISHCGFVLDNDFVCYAIHSIDKLPSNCAVYNLDIGHEDHSYIAEGFAVHNCNKDPNKQLGSVVKSAYNEPMGRVELFIHANKEKATDELQQLAKEGDIPFSMSCKVAFDRCSICNNIRLRAGDETECDHVKFNLGKMAEDGSVVHTFNDEPRFFDISFVRRPADRIAWNLKVASDNELSSVKLAEQEGVTVPDSLAIDSESAQIKYGYIKKMAEYEQLYRRLSKGTAVSGRDRFLYELRKSASALDDITVEELRKSEPATVFAKLAEHGVILDARSFFKYAMGLDLGEVKSYMLAIESRLPTIFSDLLHKEACQGVCNNTRYDVVDTQRSIPATLLSKIASAHTLVGPDMERRVVDATISGREFKIVIDTPVKIALDSGIIDTLAEEYSAYKLAAIKAISERRSSDVDTLLAAATVQNIVR